jgi:hypothetical protein
MTGPLPLARSLFVASSATVLLLTFSADGWGTQTFCAVTKETRDGFVALRQGPKASFRQLAKLISSDFLYVGTERCRDDSRGILRCSANSEWVFVEEVVSSNGMKRATQGWASKKLIRQIACPID